VNAPRPVLGARRGFTLLEVVLALGLLVFGLGVLLSLFSFGAGLARAAALRAEAAGCLSFVVADLEERLFPLAADGTVGEPLPLVDLPVSGHDSLRYSALATPLLDPAFQEPAGDGYPTLYRVQIQVAWEARGRRRALDFETLLPRSLPFGARLRRAFVEGGQIDSPLPGGNP
jgi:hypothetical protein